MTPTQGEPLSLLNVYQGMGELVLFCISLIMFFFSHTYIYLLEGQLYAG
jgi:hypothetical protein